MDDGDFTDAVIGSAANQRVRRERAEHALRVSQELNRALREECQRLSSHAPLWLAIGIAIGAGLVWLALGVSNLICGG